MTASSEARRAHRRARRSLERAGWASFDVFETLLRRSVLAPVHVFGLVHDEMASSAGMSRLSRADFVRLRMRSERLARRRKALAEGSTEVNLDEIWAALHREVPGIDPVAGARVEIDVETRVLTVRETGISLYRRARERGIPVVCVSDMYHSSSTISGWLAAAGVVPDALFVSCEMGRGKRDDLLADVAEHLGVRPRRGIHIGDSEQVDGAGARASGLVARVIPHGSSTLLAPERPPRGLGASESQLLQRAAHHWSDHGSGDLALDVGHCILGPTLAGYAAFAVGRERASGADVALYTSRDTFLVHEAANDLDRTSDVRREYAHLSRQALYVPALAGGIEDSDRELLVGGAWPMEASAFLARTGLDADLHRGALARHGLAPETLVEGDAGRRAMSAVLDDLEPQIREVARERLDELGRYLVSLGAMDARSVLLVELGWRGTIHVMLERCMRLLGWRGTLEASYLGLLWRPWPAHSGAATWLTGHPRHLRFHGALVGALPVVEAMFQADEPSVERYADGRPVLSGPVGTREVIDPIQRGARDYLAANRAAAAALVADGNPDPALALPLARLLAAPTREEAALLGRCTYSDGFGTGAPVRTILPVRRGDTGGAQWRAGRAALGRAPRR